MENERLWTRGFVLDTLINLGIYIIYYMLMVVIAVEALQMGATVAEAGLASGIYIIGVLLARLVGGRYIEITGRKLYFCAAELISESMFESLEYEPPTLLAVSDAF